MIAQTRFLSTFKRVTENNGFWERTLGVSRISVLSFSSKSSYSSTTRNFANNLVLKHFRKVQRFFKSILCLSSQACFALHSSFAISEPTGKSREGDLLATKKMGHFFANLVIECVSSNIPCVFFMRKADVFHRGRLKAIATPSEVLVDEHRISLFDWIGIEDYNHYLQKELATQYCSFQRKKGEQEWMALHNEYLFDSITKLPMITDYHIRTAQEHHKDGVPAGRHPLVELFYPILVVQGDIFEAHVLTNTFRLKKSRRVLYEHNVPVERGEGHHIDILTHTFLPDVIEEIEHELITASKQTDSKIEPISQELEAIRRAIHWK